MSPTDAFSRELTPVETTVIASSCTSLFNATSACAVKATSAVESNRRLCLTWHTGMRDLAKDIVAKSRRTYPYVALPTLDALRAKTRRYKICRKPIKRWRLGSVRGAWMGSYDSFCFYFLTGNDSATRVGQLLQSATRCRR